ncbi:MAG: ABC transporter permease [Prevotellaceae bacterium]|jgi:ABC-2 type transport system permease protein|nr:ABC transporter permease [Prevotellaceae bacterium]
MNKIFLVARREFTVRVRKKSFFVLTLLAPLLMALMAATPIIIMSLKSSDVNVVAVIDDTHSFDTVLVSDDVLRFAALPDADIAGMSKNFDASGYYALLHIGKLNDSGEPQELKFYSTKQVSLEVQQKVVGMLSREVEQRKLKAHNIPQLLQIIQDSHTRLHAATVKWGNNSEEQSTHAGVTMAISYASAFLIYMFIFMFGGMVMRSVIEEKVNRVVEVIVSSIRPFQLMMGKILGVAAVGLLQFTLWIVLTLLLVGVPGQLLASAEVTGWLAGAGAANHAIFGLSGIGDLHALGYLSGLNFTWIIACFVLFFLGGYLLYSSLFAAVGSAVESEADTRQLMLPISMPLIAGIFVMLNTFQYPDSALSFWFSIIPFTSPIVMMARIPFGVPVWQVALSLGILYATFVATVWVSGRIYRVGILMYGKKPTLKELLKWMMYR